MQIRPAAAVDQATITAMVRAAQLNPVNLRWPNFMLAVEDGQIAGVGQLRPHSDGSRELASLVVREAYRRRGVGSQLTRALLANQQPPIHLFCRHELESYYSRFGFHQVEGGTLPRPLLRLFRMGSLVTRVGAFFSRSSEHLIAMRWEG